MMDIRALNAVARQERSTLPQFNNFGIGEIETMPPLFYWVECAACNISFRMFLGGSDDGIALRFFWNGRYEAATMRAWSTLAADTEIAFDIGAHTGAYTLAALAANPGISAYAFEPHFMNFARLNLNLRANGHRTANAWMVAIGAKDQTVPFSTSSDIDYLSAGGAVGSRPNAQVQKLRMIALDLHTPAEFKAKVGLVKIDTEGHENECLAGMADIIAQARPVIFFECIDDQAGASVAARLMRLDYRYYAVDDLAGSITPVETIAPDRDSSGNPLMHRLNRIAVPAEKVTEAPFGAVLTADG